MRFSLASVLTFLCLGVIGCGRVPEVSGPAVATPSPSPGNPPAGVPADFGGVWTTADEQGQVFDIVLFANGQAVTNWAKGTEGPVGQRGFWRVENGRVFVFFNGGWTDVIEVEPGGAFRHKGFSPAASLADAPTNSAAASRVTGSNASFIGVWRLNKEPDGNYLYIALQSNGRAVSTINGGTEGTWVVDGETARATWPDGWVDALERSPEGWRKRSWVGPNPATDADVSEALRVGDAKFEVTP